MLHIHFYLIFAAVLVGIIVAFVILKNVKGLKDIAISTDVGGIIYGGIVAVYSILLAFVVVIVWGQYQTTGDRVQNEAAKLFNIYRSSYAFPDAEGKPLREAVVDYARSVSTDEWLAMDHDTTSAITQHKYNRLWELIYAIKPQTTDEQVWYGSIVESVNQFGEARLIRISDVQASIPSIMWKMLLAGGAIMLLFAMLFKGGNKGIHLFKVLLFSILIIFNLELIYLLDHPFKGILKVTPEPFEKILYHYQQEQK